MQYTLFFLAQTDNKQKTDKKANSRFAKIMLCSSNKLFSVSLFQMLLLGSFHFFSLKRNQQLFKTLVKLNQSKCNPTVQEASCYIFFPSLKIIPSKIYIMSTTYYYTQTLQTSQTLYKKLLSKNVQCGHCHNNSLRERKKR